MPEEHPTVPSYQAGSPYALVLSPQVEDEDSGAVWTHRDYNLEIRPWEKEEHIGPIEGTEQLGDVASWAEYIKRYGAPVLRMDVAATEEAAPSEAAEAAPAEVANGEAIELAAAHLNGEQATFITWNTRGLRAVLDYHTDEGPGRCKWLATYAFELTPAFRDWSVLANGRPTPQKDAVNFIEDHWQHVTEPDAATLLDILRKLRASVNATADSKLNPDGTFTVDFHKATGVQGGADGSVTLPHEITIAVPVIKGHVDADGRPQVFKLVVRVRASVGDNAQLSLIFTMPQVEEVLDTVYDELVAMAKAALGEDYTILRAAG